MIIKEKNLGRGKIFIQTVVCFSKNKRMAFLCQKLPVLVTSLCLSCNTQYPQLEGRENCFGLSFQSMMGWLQGRNDTMGGCCGRKATGVRETQKQNDLLGGWIHEWTQHPMIQSPFKHRRPWPRHVRATLLYGPIDCPCHKASGCPITIGAQQVPMGVSPMESLGGPLWLQCEWQVLVSGNAIACHQELKTVD